MSIISSTAELYPLLTQINKIVEEELFPLIGLPKETYIKGISNIPANLKEIVFEIQKIGKTISDEQERIRNISQKTRSLLEKIKIEEIILDIPKLFE